MIFISYRQADSESVVGRIYSELKKHYPTQHVFLDHDSIPLGKPFVEVIKERLASSKFALVLIGPQWCSITDEKTGQRRLDDPSDIVRLEVETALATSGVDVIPVWVMRATTSAEEIARLPLSIQPLFQNNGISLRPVPDEDGDIRRLLGKMAVASNPIDGRSDALDKIETELMSPTRGWRWGAAAFGIAATLILFIIGAWLLTRPSNKTDEQAKSTELVKPSPPVTPPRPVAYKGSIDLLVHRKDTDGSDLAVPLSDVRAAPLKPGDSVKVTAEIDPPAYVYLFWIDESGATFPIYPWTPLKWDTRPATEKKVARVEVKDPNGNWFKISGPTAGMETLQMLASSEPLHETEAQVKNWFRDLQPLPFPGEKARVWFEGFDLVRHDPTRSPAYAGTMNPEDGPLGLQAVLQRRIGARVRFSRAVSFSRLGKR